MSKELEADRELDYKIAELLGWIQIEDAAGWQSPDGVLNEWPGPPAFSTDISNAWKIIERLRAIGVDILISTEGDKWEVELVVNETLYAQGLSGSICMQATVTLAICRAALLTLGIKPRRWRGE